MRDVKSCDCTVCGNGPVEYHAGMCVMGHPKAGDVVAMNSGMYYVCEILPNYNPVYQDRTLFKGSYCRPFAPCDAEFMKDISL